MKIVNHYTSAVETITVNPLENKIIVENQCYSLTGRKTKTYVKTYDGDNVPPDILEKIKKEENRLLEEENESPKKI